MLVLHTFFYCPGRRHSTKHRCVTHLYRIPLGIFNYVLLLHAKVQRCKVILGQVISTSHKHESVIQDDELRIKNEKL